MPEKTDISNAEMRVREMERVAKGFLEQTNRVIRQNRPQERERSAAPQEPMRTRFEPVYEQMADEVPAQPASASASCETAVRKAGLSFEPDSEKILIILLIVLLMKENADIKLIAALAYLLI